MAPAAAQADPFIGQVILTGYNFCPRNFIPAEGQLMSIAQNTALFSLYGTIYGGDGRTTFGIPDLRGRAPIHYGQGPGLQYYNLGEKGGQTGFTLTIPQLPSHTHTVNATNQLADKGGPQDRYLGAGMGDDDYYHDGPPTRTMAAGMLSPTGGNEEVKHRGPYIAMQWCVALYGVYPSRN
ncbi:phage tail protein [Parvularcula flava]|uniref:Phage tail protein n=1 Tax=Aquisalinus luteolus TaxID=1566827 RepID=A0ABX0HHR6_9PROT|nr:phage tail protein [Aquisalinus luteolus]